MQKLILPFILLIVFFLYYPTLSVYFSHDDFFQFKASLKETNVLEFFTFAPFEERGYAFWRPLFREVLHNVYFEVFGMNHIPMRLLLLTIHLINIVFTYFLFLKIFLNKRQAILTALFFGITAAHVGTLYYIPSMEIAGATMFILLAMILFMNYLNGGKSKYKVGALTAFMLALVSHEFSAIVPLLLVGLVLLKANSRQLKKALIFSLWPFFVILTAYLYLDIVKIGFLQEEQQYKPTFSIKGIFNSFSWYMIWALSFPEMLLDFVGPKFTLNPNLMKFWVSYFTGIFIFGGLVLTILVTSISYLLVKKNVIFKDKKLWFFVFWFVIALSPVILLPLHKATYYLGPALPAFGGLVVIILSSFNNELKKRSQSLAKYLIGIFIVSFVILSIISIQLGDKTYPAANRGRIAQKLIDDVKTIYPELPKDAIVYFKNDPNYPKISGDWGGSSKQAELALNGSDAMQLVYNDPTIIVIYEGSGQKVPSENVYPLVAKLSD